MKKDIKNLKVLKDSPKLTKKNERQLAKQLLREFNANNAIYQEKRKKSDAIDKEEQKQLNKLERAKLIVDKKSTEDSLNAEYFELSKIAKGQKLSERWLQLDNAGLIYPAASKREINSVYRFTVILKEKVEPTTLQLAINDIMPRFPSMTSAIRKGLFWYYLETPTQPLVLEKQTDYPCRRMPNDYRHSIIRIIYFDNQISVEFFHSATDGSGAIIMLNTLIKRYLELLNNVIKDRTNCKNALDLPQPEEIEDNFQRVVDKKTKIKIVETKAYHINGAELETNALIVTKGICNSIKLKQIAKQFDATIGQLLNGILMYSLQQEKEFNNPNSKLPIRVSNAVNLRKIFPTQSLRNFSSYINLESKGTKTLTELIALCKEQFEAKYNKDYFLTMINLNVKSQHNFFIKILPLPLKNIALKISFNLLGERLWTSNFSNMGSVQCPSEFKDHVARYDLIFGPQYSSKIAIGIISYLETTVISFSRTIKDSFVEKCFFRVLGSLGIDIVVECNV